MLKNVASQKIAVFAFTPADGLPKTGDAANLTAYVSKDWGTVTVLGDTTATEMDATNAPGWYLFDLTQGETNADALLFSGKSSTAGVKVVGAVVFTRPPNFTSLVINASGQVSVISNIKKNQALSKFAFLMTDSTNHNPATGKTVSCVRSIDGGSFASGTLANITEVGNGIYVVDFLAADLNGNVITLRATASGCDDTVLTIITEP